MIHLVILLFLHASCTPQASHHIWRESDLLAVDSDNSYSVSVAAPQSFLDQLAMASQSVSKQAFLPTPLPASGPSQPIRVADSPEALPITTSYSNQRNNDGSYSFGYSTSGGVSRTESGSLTSTGYQVKGSYEYLGSDGIKYTVEFVADENGYRPRISKSQPFSHRRGRTLIRKSKKMNRIKRKRKRRIQRIK